MIQKFVTVMAGLIMDYSGVCLCCPSNFEAMEEQDLSNEEDADYLSFPREHKNLLHILIQKKSGWKLYYRVIGYIDGCI